MERAVHRLRNYNVINLGDVITTTGALASGRPDSLIFAVARRIFEAPTVKAKIAFALNKSGKITGESLGKGVGTVLGKYEAGEKLKPIKGPKQYKAENKSILND